jgi:[ribosomal protein S18]-alanine N-acetyltransferase
MMEKPYRFSLQLMNRDDARAVSEWKYDGIYAFYDAPVPTDDSDLYAMLDGSHYSVLDSTGGLVGFFAYGPSATVPGGHRVHAYDDDALDVGLGLRPDLTGQGLGFTFVQSGLNFALNNFAPVRFRLTVATFNERAIRVYERAGFHRGEIFPSETPNGDAEFLLMVTDPL